MQPFELLFKITERLLKNCLLFMKNNKISFRLKRVQECKPHHSGGGSFPLSPSYNDIIKS